MIICLVIMFALRVMIIKMSKMADFLYFPLMPAKNQSQFGENICMNLKDLIWLFQKMLWIVGFWATISKISALEDTGFHYFFADSEVFNISTLDNSRTVTLKLIHFLKELKKIIQVHLKVLPELWLTFCCRQQKIQKINHFFTFQ